MRVVGERAVGEKGGKRNAETRGNPGAAQRRLTLQCCAVGTAVAHRRRMLNCGERVGLGLRRDSIKSPAFFARGAIETTKTVAVESLRRDRHNNRR